MINKIRKAFFYSVYALLVAELVIRCALFLFFPFKDQSSAVPRNIGQFDSRLGWSLKSFSIGYSDATGSKIEYKINSHGLRSREAGYEKPDNIFRIILLGDSRTFGYGCSIEKHFSSLIENNFKDLEVINMGVCGYGVDQELLALELEGLKYRPDLVLAYVAHYGDERHTKTEIFGKSKPRFILKDNKLLLINSPVKDAPVPFLRKVDAYLSSHSKIYYYCIKLPLQILRKSGIGRDGEVFVLGEKIIEEMDSVAKSNSAEFVLVTQVSHVVQQFNDARIRVLDLSRLFDDRKYELPNGLGHVNEEGNAYLAQVITEYLKANGLVPKAYWKN